MSYLFGNILTVSSFDIYMLLAVNIIILTGLLFYYRSILYIAFDEEFARTRNIPVSTIKYIIIGVIALTTIFSIRIAGVVLIISLLSLPQVTANLFYNNFKSIMILAIIIALVGIMSGLIISFYLNIPSGATIIFSLTLIFFICRLYLLFTNKRNLKKFQGIN